MGFFALGVPLFFVFLSWDLPAGTQRGAFLFPLFSCSVCFLLGSSPGFGARVFPPPPRKSGSRPSLRGVCVCGVAEYPATKPFSAAGGARGRARLAPTKTFALACDINLGRKIDVPAPVIQSPFGPLFLSLCVLVTFSTLEGSRVLREPKLIVLETYQLYSRLISCTRDSSVVLERLAPSLGS